MTDGREARPLDRGSLPCVRCRRIEASSSWDQPDQTRTFSDQIAESFVFAMIVSCVRSTIVSGGQFHHGQGRLAALVHVPLRRMPISVALRRLVGRDRAAVVGAVLAHRVDHDPIVPAGETERLQIARVARGRLTKYLGTSSVSVFGQFRPVSCRKLFGG